MDYKRQKQFQIVFESLKKVVKLQNEKNIYLIQAKSHEVSRLFIYIKNFETSKKSWLLPPEYLDPRLKTLSIAKAQKTKLEDFKSDLVEVCGYQKIDMVYEKKQFMQKGDSIIIYSNLDNLIVKVDFIFDEVEKISLLDFTNMREVEEIISFAFINIDKEDLSFDPELLGVGNEINLDETLFIHDNDYKENYENSVISELPFFKSNKKLFKRYIDQLNSENPIKNVFYIGNHEVENLPEGFCEVNSLPVQKLDIPFVLEKGFFQKESGLLLLTDREISSQLSLTKSKTKYSSKFKKLFDNEIKLGDYIVHEAHGVGIYAGIETKLVDDKIQDYVVINYRNEDRLLIPFSQLHRVSKFISADGREPKLTRLGTAEWSVITRKLKKSVEDIAQDLLTIYAKKSLEKGYKFDHEKDQDRKNIELNFPYQLTIDQIKTLNEVFEDMESEKPMDRLIIGDVGFGKTEIAIRASYKAVCNKKQVMVIAPTTILVTQLFEVFNKRLSELGIRLARVSRFDGTIQNKKSIIAASKGEIDILIGTHRLLSKDVELKDLGLLIIDEEQRFGVKQKERIRTMRANIDLLSMSATPIPRTLQMALTGIKDISIIATPPKNRKSVKTFIAFSHEVEEKIRAEVKRGGQVFFVHNKVEDIEKVVADLSQTLGEDIRITYGHGQMKADKLEKVMFDFSEKKYDVLVATTIIENGIDIPSVNTILINNAQNFGVSQIYQLRGRVGRSDIEGHCYLVVPKTKDFLKLHKSLSKKDVKLKTLIDDPDIDDKWATSEEGVERIKVILENQELGAGFKIATRDLEIRGSGNILGSEQSGHINAVGYEMFVRLLEQEIESIRKKMNKLDKKTDL